MLQIIIQPTECMYNRKRNFQKESVMNIDKLFIHIKVQSNVLYKKKM